MTTPNVQTGTEEFGTLEVFGIPFSTFTRTITMGLQELGLDGYYMQHKTKPHSKEVLQHNPFGLLPVLIHRPNALYDKGADVVMLYEANAIRRYLDEFIGPAAARKFGSKVTELTPKASSHDDSHTAREVAAARARVDQWVSLASSILFPTVEHAVVKPRCAMEGNGADDATVRVGIEEGIERLDDKLKILEQELITSSQGDYLCGKAITWADLFVYPFLADLRAVPEGDVVKGSGSKYPKVTAWLDRMDARQSAKNTYDGTLACIRQK